MARVTLKVIGERCRQYRKALGYRQADVAAETSYSVENISLFERGRNDNMMILLWYLDKGMPFYDLLKG